MPIPTSKPLLVRLDADLKQELDRLRSEEGLRMNFIVNVAVREWIERYNAPIDTVRRGVERQLARDAKARAKEEREWRAYQLRVLKTRQRGRKEER